MIEERESALVVAEFTALREEILKRIEIQHQILSLTLIVAGAFLTVGVQTNGTVSIAAILFYPILAMFLAAMWTQQYVRVGQAALYIREELEPYSVATGWEHFKRLHAFNSRWGPFGVRVLAVRGLFITTQIVATILAVVRLNAQIPLLNLPVLALGEHINTLIILGILLLADVVAIFITNSFLSYRNRREWKIPETPQDTTSKLR